MGKSASAPGGARLPAAGGRGVYAPTTGDVCSRAQAGRGRSGPSCVASRRNRPGKAPPGRPSRWPTSGSAWRRQGMPWAPRSSLAPRARWGGSGVDRIRLRRLVGARVRRGLAAHGRPAAMQVGGDVAGRTRPRGARPGRVERHEALRLTARAHGRAARERRARLGPRRAHSRPATAARVRRAQALGFTRGRVVGVLWRGGRRTRRGRGECRREPWSTLGAKRAGARAELSSGGGARARPFLAPRRSKLCFRLRARPRSTAVSRSARSLAWSSSSASMSSKSRRVVGSALPNQRTTWR